MDKVWLVTTGSYSDYSVIVAFASKELADQFAATKPDLYAVEDFPFLDRMPAPAKTVWSAQALIRNGMICESDSSWEWSDALDEWDSWGTNPTEYSPSIHRSVTTTTGGSIVRLQVRGPAREEVRRRLKQLVADELAKPV